MPRVKSLAAFEVEEFHDVMGLPIRDVADGSTTGTQEQRDLRCRLILEEAQEFVDACEDNDLVAMADALADLLYVTYGAAVTFGIPLDSVVQEVHRSNMTKLWSDDDLAILPGPADGSGDPDGIHGVKVMLDGSERHTVVYDGGGKVLKPPSFQPPNVLRELLRRGEF